MSFTRNELKTYALCLMTIGHIAETAVLTGLSGDGLLINIQRALSYGAAPVFIFFVIEGYYKTGNVKKYLLRLWLFGALSQIPYSMLFGIWNSDDLMESVISTNFNMLFTLCLCLLTAISFDHLKKAKYPVLLILFLISGICDWNFLALPLALAVLFSEKNKESFIYDPLIESIRKNKKPLNKEKKEKDQRLFKPDSLKKAFRVYIIYYFIIQLMDLLEKGMAPLEAFFKTILFSIMPYVSLYLISNCYDGRLSNERDSKKILAKYFFYFYYPLHLMLLGLLRLVA